MRLPVTLVLALLAAGAGRAEERRCPGVPVIVEAAGPDGAAEICAAARDAARLFAECGVPALRRPVRIRRVPALPEGCAARYHCGEDRIEILAPDRVAATRRPDAPLAFLDAESFHRSVVVHELAHAAMENTPCPFATCVAAQEFVAYNLQILSLAPADRARFAAAIDPATIAAPERLNPFVLAVDPDAFLRRSWLWLGAQPGRCAYLGRVARGEIVLDQGEM